jgi:hypothetical protein
MTIDAVKWFDTRQRCGLTAPQGGGKAPQRT